MKIALIQINPVIGDFTANCKKVSSFVSQAKEKGCDLAIFPELAICGYPPQDLLERWFEERNDLWYLNPEITANVTIRSHDTLKGLPPGVFQLILVRNSVFTYNTPDVRSRFTGVVRKNLAPPGLLVVGRKEALPESCGFERVGRGIYRKVQGT